MAAGALLAGIPLAGMLMFERQRGQQTTESLSYYEQLHEQYSYASLFVLTRDVPAGEELTADMIRMQRVQSAENLSDVQSLTEEDLLIEAAQTPGFASNSDHGITVVLDTNLTPELIEEGYMRELVSKIQTMRKESGFEVMDNIRVYISGSDVIKDVVKKNFDEIKGEVLAKDVVFDTDFAAAKDWDLNGQAVKLGVEKL